MAIKVLNPGLASTIQDLGRPGYYEVGIPMSGAMDRLALKAANLLVGNGEGAAGIEAVFVGPKLEFTQNVSVAVTGADMPVRLDGEPKPNWTSFAVKAGQVLSCDYLRSGARIYIAVSGGIDVPVVLGSRSTYPLGQLGGFQGRALKAGDELPVGDTNGAKSGLEIPETLRRSPGREAELRVVPGLYWFRMTDRSHEYFFNDEWKVAPEADRIGYRFRGGHPIEFNSREQPFGAGSDPSNIVDACYPYGSVQVPGGSEPIVLHRDAVSVGGYFMLGTVISADLDLIGQLQPHAPARFVKVDMDTALKARADRNALIGKIRGLF